MDFAAINFFTRKKIYSKLNYRKIAKSFYIFLKTPDEVEKYPEMMQSSSSDNCVHRYDIEILNLLDPELQLINNKPMFENKLKELLSELKNRL